MTLADFEQHKFAVPRLYISVDFIEQTRQHTQAVVLKVWAESVREAEGLGWVLACTLEHTLVHKAVAQHFVGTRLGQCLAHNALELTAGVFTRWLNTAHGQLARHSIKAVQPANFLNDILFRF